LLEDYSEKQLNNIIDCLDPDWVPVTDEYMIKENKISGWFSRSFETRRKGSYNIIWRVDFVTPETVKTVFESMQRIQ